MTHYFVKRLDQGGGYLARPGSAKSYTHNILSARPFATREAAQKECCGNERAVSFEEEQR